MEQETVCGLRHTISPACAENVMFRLLGILTTASVSTCRYDIPEAIGRLGQVRVTGSGVDGGGTSCSQVCCAGLRAGWGCVPLCRQASPRQGPAPRAGPVRSFRAREPEGGSHQRAMSHSSPFPSLLSLTASVGALKAALT